MHINTRNVNTAFKGFVEGMSSGKIPTIRAASRNGKVYKIPEPVTITYQAPIERVLFNKARDANPFFHLYESLWMLAGRRDVAAPAFYAKQIRDYSDNGRTLNGAYGHRWRYANVGSCSVGTDQPTEIDQLDEIIRHLRAKPESRRAVLSMWNVEDDLLKVDTSKDVCCNTQAYFSLRFPDVPLLDVSSRSSGPLKQYLVLGPYLDMTVTNRSNDMIWGALGANVVHFSMLQEYLACCLGAEVGVYNQFTNDLHVYEWNWKPLEWLEEYKPIGPISPVENIDWYEQGYRTYRYVPLVQHKDVFDREVKVLVKLYSQPRAILTARYEEPFLENVARPMLNAWNFYKAGDISLALFAIKATVALDWREAGVAWLERRQAKRVQNEQRGSKNRSGSSEGQGEVRGDEESSDRPCSGAS